MLFYKVNVALSETLEDMPEEARRALAAELHAKTSAYNSRNMEQVFFFVIQYKLPRAELAVCLNAFGDAQGLVRDILNTLELHYDAYELDEITLEDFRIHLGLADRHGFIDDNEDPFRPFDSRRNSFRNLCYRECMIPVANSREELDQKASELLWNETLSPELDRIYQGSQRASLYAHPVHYLLSTGEEDSEPIREVLLSALYANGRLHGRRYAVLPIETDGSDSFSERELYSLCKSFQDCAIVIRLRVDIDDTGEFAAPEMDRLESICEAIQLYRGSVLFLLSLPAKAASIKEKLFDELTGMTFVELKEDIVFGDQAKAYLSGKAEKHGLESDAALLEAANDPSRGFTAAELDLLFDAWYARQLKTTVFPQYAPIASLTAKAATEKARGSGYSQLEELVGLSEAKRVIEKALNFYRMRKVFRAHGLGDTQPAMHMVFTGAPGTAKTTVARLFAQIMKENGLLSEGKLVEVGRADLVGKYVGHTAPQVKRAFKQATGGVLFIDEAYSLVDDRDGLFGDEAINTIVQEMENHREDTVVIFAGYPDKMQGFLDKNPGLRSRIAFHVPFADYSAAELLEITALTAKRDGFTLSPEVGNVLLPMFEKARTHGDFGNGRYARNVLEQARMNQADRLVRMDIDNLSRADVTTLLPEDFAQLDVVTEPEPEKTVRVLGFTA